MTNINELNDINQFKFGTYKIIFRDTRVKFRMKNCQDKEINQDLKIYESIFYKMHTEIIFI